MSVSSKQVRESQKRKKMGKTKSFYCALCGQTALIVDVEAIFDREMEPSTRWKRVHLECQTCEDAIAATIDVPWDRYTTSRKVHPRRRKA